MKKLLSFLVISMFLLPSSMIFSKNIQHYNYVIITIDDLQNAVNKFKQWKESMGYNVKIVTISWIESNYNGKDIQEKIRNFLIDKYEQWGIDYVLIVGSRDKIPMRDCYPDPFNHKDHGTDHIISTDYYYADLNGNWDADKDGYYGEYLQDKPDFYPEVYVGRIPSDDAEKVESICQHIINFEKSNETWKKSVLLLAPVLFYENYTNQWGKWHRSDGATLMEECWNDIFKPNGFTAIKMYEKEGIRPSTYACDYKLNHSNVLAEWKKHGIINLVGHSSFLSVYRCVWASDDGDKIPEDNELKFYLFIGHVDAPKLSMDKPPIVFSGGCDQLYRSRNMGRIFMEDGAACAFIGATGMSWYNVSRAWNSEKDGGGLSIDYYFFHYLINENQKIGNALYNAKVYYYNHFGFPITFIEWSDRVLRFYVNLYAFNLYGDPSLGINTKITDSNPPTINIEKPKNYLYVSNKEILPTPFPIIIGGITIDANAIDENGIKKVEFYVDNHLKESMESKPYSWMWNEFVIGMHKIKVVCYDNADNIAGDEEKVLIFNI